MNQIDISADDLLGLLVHNCNKLAGMIAAGGLRCEPDHVEEMIGILAQKAHQYRAKRAEFIAAWQAAQPETSGQADARPN